MSSRGVVSGIEGEGSLFSRFSYHANQHTQTNTHTNTGDSVCTTVVMFLSTGINCPKAEIMQRDNTRCPSDLCLYVFLIIHFIILIYHNSGCHLSTVTTMSGVKKEPHWNPKTCTHYSRNKKRHRRETGKHIKSVWQWRERAVGVLTGGLLSGPALSPLTLNAWV